MAHDSDSSKLSRRDFVAAAAAVTVIGLSTPAAADDLPRIDEADPTAQALKYVHDASTVDPAQRPADQFCNNCALFGGAADDAWAPCSIFPGKAVAGAGWCSVWAPKAG